MLSNNLSLIKPNVAKKYLSTTSPQYLTILKIVLDNIMLAPERMEETAMVVVGLKHVLRAPDQVCWRLREE